MSKKKIFVVALAVCIVAILSMGSLAWFTDTDTATNKFLVAGSDDADPDEIFSVDVWEYVDPENDGDPVKTGEGPDEAAEAEYITVLPGDKLTKEPHVENTGSYAQYIRVTVTITDATAWLNAGLLDVNMADVLEGFDEAMWTDISTVYDGETDTIIYVLYFNGQLQPGQDITLFNYVNIPTSLTQQQAAAFEGGFEIDIKADAVQTENVGNSAIEAFRTVGLA